MKPKDPDDIFRKKKKKKKKEAIEFDYSDHPVHEEYAEMGDVKK